MSAFRRTSSIKREHDRVPAAAPEQGARSAVGRDLLGQPLVRDDRKAAPHEELTDVGLVEVDERRHLPDCPQLAAAVGEPVDEGARHASPLPTGRGRRQGGSGDGLGRAGPGKWAPGNFLLSLFYFCFVLFNLFCHCFEFKIIQTMPKTPLNILYC